MEKVEYRFIVDQWLWATGINTLTDVLDQLACLSDQEIAQELWDAWADDDWDRRDLIEAVAAVRQSYASVRQSEEGK